MNKIKSTNKRKHVNKKISEQGFEKQLYQVIPLCFIAGLVPLILYFKAVVTNDPGNMFRDGHNIHLDIFSYYKMVFILLLSATGLLTYLFLKKDKSIDSNKRVYYIPMGIYVIFVLLSAFTSDYKEVSFFGYIERYEGAFILIAYIVILFLAMNVINDEKLIKMVLASITVSAFIISIIGALQYFGLDYYKSQLFLDIVTPNDLRSQIADIKTRFPAGTILTTLSNPNYVGSYMAMLLPITLIFSLYSKKMIYRICFTVVLCLVAINWIGCESRAGIVGGAISLLMLLIMLRKKVAQHKIVAIVAALLIAVSIPVINFITGGSFVNRIERMISLEGKDISASDNSAFNNKIKSIRDIKMNSTQTSILTDQGTVKISVITGKLIVKDENDNEVEFVYNNDDVNILDKRFDEFKLGIKPDAGLIEVYFNEFKLINILSTQNGLKSSSNFWMTYRGDKEIETFGFSGMESFGSNRGYIWSRTLPLLKDTIILGYGPDTFPLHFPQYDYMGKLRMYQTGGIFVDKPHNMYLQVGISTGIISLIALLVIFGIYFGSSIKLFINEDFNTYLPIVGLGCFAAFCSYCAAGLFNDSVVTVAPIFWVLLGLGISINIKLIQLKKNVLKTQKCR